ncbi:hypothetical protein [Sulfobacillus thermosulfidooxidans]|uniref:hypothetical protein n=1 Tax=Sulfobacillus thermosulfidooxidans TaxID=28034 RepID=UPI00030D29E4|nr:hypothetical protein [Sulfobacillus thermosulfidooxidans]
MFGALFLAFNAVTLYARIQSDRNRMNQALLGALQAATAKGATAVHGVVVWNTASAQSAAVQILPQFLPVQLAATTTQGAQYTPLPTAPPDWTGTLTLGDFQTSDTAGTATLFGQSQAVPGPFVAADLSVPVTERFFGVPLHFTLQVGRISQVYGYNGHQFTQFP